MDVCFRHLERCAGAAGAVRLEVRALVIPALRYAVTKALTYIIETVAALRDDKALTLIRDTFAALRGDKGSPTNLGYGSHAGNNTIKLESDRSSICSRLWRA
ncbi:hypothetical protein GCM10023184_10570 [Flaviaesturariibacter amylovorans]|uniref:Uncharacterized protein n=1 Tax=Flaviaesturariibacter amylovorans TaxID=1084520 RepID=A0ABP8GFT0_9BACT